ncbi:unnamed protein product [Clavelina lepadiformis]|uniref:Fructose-2,6-bisphosphatase TIGAR n=1 Tax=Clavelina lepadiformis TaxID=159417 RepID=A0ABP0FDU1_CLALP
MSKKFQLTVVRHGETNYNFQRIVQGHTDVPLNENGQMQAIKLGKCLSQEKFSHWFTSDLRRASETCRLIKSQNKFAQLNSEPEDVKCQTKFDNRIRERSFGVLEGKPSSELHEAAKHACLSLREFTAEGGETEMQIRKRAEEFYGILFTQIYDECSNSDSEFCANVFVVSHGGIINSTCLLFNSKFGCQFEENLPYYFHNCSTSCFIVNLPPSCDDGSSIQFEVDSKDLDESFTHNWLDGVTIKCTKLGYEH